MKVKELKELLAGVPDDYEIYVNMPDNSQDLFIENISAKHMKNQAFIETSE